MTDEEKHYYVIKKRLAINDTEFLDWPGEHGIDLENLEPNQKFVEVRIMPPGKTTKHYRPLSSGNPLYGILDLKENQAIKLVYFNKDKGLEIIEDPKKIIYNSLDLTEEMRGGKRRYRRSSNKRKSSKKSRKSKRKSKRTSRR